MAERPELRNPNRREEAALLEAMKPESYPAPQISQWNFHWNPLSPLRSSTFFGWSSSAVGIAPREDGQPTVKSRAGGSPLASLGLPEILELRSAAVALLCVEADHRRARRATVADNRVAFLADVGVGADGIRALRAWDREGPLAGVADRPGEVDGGDAVRTDWLEGMGPSAEWTNG